MKYRGFKLILLVCVLISSSILVIQGDPGDVSDPIVATLGDNSDTLDLKGDMLYYSFTTTPDQWYNFSLTGPEGTTFHMEVTKASSIAGLGQAYAWYYPNFVELGDLPNEIWIKVFSWEGAGDFTLTITEIEKQPILELLSYSDEIVKDKVYTWDMYLFWDFSFKTGTGGLNHGDNVTVVWPVNGDEVRYNLSDPTTDVKTWVQVNNVNITEDQNDDLAYLFEPTYYLFDDGSETGLKDALIATYANWGYLDFSETDDEYVMGGNYKSTFGNKTVYIKIDKTSGIVNSYYYLKYTSNKIEDHWEQTRIKDPSELTTTSDTDTTTPVDVTSDTGTALDAETPIDPLWFAIPLMLVPIIRRKKTKNVID